LYMSLLRTGKYIFSQLLTESVDSPCQIRIIERFSFSNRDKISR